jgi:hypothetical protein
VKHGNRVTLLGGVSARTLDMKEPKKIIEEVEECCQLGIGHSLKYPPEKIEVMHRAWMEKGFYKNKY